MSTWGTIYVVARDLNMKIRVTRTCALSTKICVARAFAPRGGKECILAHLSLKSVEQQRQNDQILVKKSS